MGRPRKDSATKPVQERLEDAMIKRMLDEPVGAVSARELAEDTACNRSTFYYYFNDIDEIANAALDRAIPYELPLTIASLMVTYGTEPLSSQRFDELLEQHAKIDPEQVDMLCLLLNGPNGPLVERKVKDALSHIYPTIVDALPNEGARDELSLRIIFEYASSAILGLMAYRGAIGLSVPVERMIGAVAPEVPRALIGCINRATHA